MDPWTYDEEPTDVKKVLVGPSSSPPMELAYNLHNKVSRGNSYGGAERNFTKGGGNHEDLDVRPFCLFTSRRVLIRGPLNRRSTTRKV